MAAALSNLSRLSIQDGEGIVGASTEKQEAADNRVVIADEDWLEVSEGESVHFNLLGKLFSKRRANVEGLRVAMFQAWKPECDLVVKEASDNLYIFQFDDANERDRVLVNQPWSFNRSLLLLREFSGLQVPEEVNFDTCPIWMRVFKLPILLMTEKIGRAVGAAMGNVLEVDQSCSRYLRLRVSFNVNNPLMEEQACPLGTYQLKTQGFMTKKFSDYLRAETPDIMPRQFHSGASGSKLTGLGGRNNSRRNLTAAGSVDSRPGALLGHVDSQLLRGGAVGSVDSRPAALLGHVDSQLLRGGAGGAVANAVVSGERYGEANSRLFGVLVPTGKEVEENVESHTGLITRRLRDDSLNPEIEGRGNGSNQEAKSARKWRKLARGSVQEPDDKQATQSATREGKKRGFNGGIMASTGAGATKRSRDRDERQRGVIAISADKKELFSLELSGCRADPNSSSGGLALLWFNNVDISILSYSNSHIDAQIGSNMDNAWRFTSFYGRPETHRRNESWHLLRTLNANCSLPWLCAGDFNEITKSEEKVGGGLRPFTQMQNFSQVIEDCFFTSLPVIGPLMTWHKKLHGEFIFERLDRALITNSWLERFSHSTEKHVISNVSDHLPLVISIQEQPTVQWRGPKPFRFESMWCTPDGFEQVVREAWTNDGHKGISNNLMACKRALSTWNRSVFGNVRHKLEWKRKELGEMLEAGTNTERIEECKNDLNVLLHQEEVMWRQRSKALWFSQGDRNTRYFHSIASDRRKRNLILGIEDGAGEWKTTMADVENIACNYYKELFSSSNPSNEALDKVLALVPGRIDDQMRALLDAPFTATDIKEAVFQMQGEKAPGPDGFPPTFYQKCWSTVGKDVIEFALNFLNNGGSLSHINHTNIVLIPKIENPRTMKDFRPIALCNVLFKIISKTIANRLKLILPQIIGESQSAFVPDRMIFDNALIAFETIHFMCNKRSGKRAHLALKLDLSKAYDKVEWIFLEKCMYRLGFSSHWIELVMEGIRSVSYSILINGQQTARLSPTRGIRQGDPLSPYLFLFCMEAFSCLISNAEATNLIHGVAINRAAPSISHLFFADDSLIFLRAALDECEVVLNILHDFELATGQQVNIDKSAILFSSNISSGLQDSIMRRLGVSRVLERDKYLGLPIMIGKNKKQELNFIKERLLQRVASWRNKLFSIVGKAIMIHSIAQSIPVYLMSVFRFPKSFIHELNMIIAKFWWGSTNDNRKIHWMAWETMCVLKLDGGLGFRDFEAFNLALLAKQCWRLIHNQDSLCFRLFKGEVADIMDFEERRWRIDELMDIVVDEDVSRILCLPIPRLPGRDTLIWDASSSGNFSVKSAYYVARQILGHDVNIDDESRKLWRRVWGSSIPPKIHYFIWRLIWNLLPIKTNLQQRGMDIDDLCVVCGLSVESLGHVFFECCYSRQVGILLKQLEQARPKAISRVPARNDSWQAPGPGMVKINTDASFNQDTCQAGLGVGFRDSEGNVLVCACRKLSFISSPLYAEIHAILFGFELALEYDIDNCIFESDCLNAVSIINSNSPVWWEGACLIYEIRELVSLFDHCNFVHARREANELAHRMAQLEFDFVRCGSLPPSVCIPDFTN
ncbi:reverse transcriptase [Corchorus capsularis]|uniref:Reverse transcriptase n=1 Tax=Corchorus capsularis TaxID=210143 RepID=A0A1R3H2S5_COCAP|nr:reverse transcriptase [Corchorus capsularis]